MAKVTAGEVDYLMALLQLEEAGRDMTAANVARELSVSAPTVHEMVRRLEGDGLIERDARKRIAFTARGGEIAREAASRHRIVERFLTDVLHIPWHRVHSEAEKIERTLSDEVAERMRAAIGNATTCPHGHPIEAGARVRCATRLNEVEPGTRVTVLRFEDERDATLTPIADAGLRRGIAATVATSDEDQVVLRLDDGGDATVGVDQAGTITVWSTPTGN
jgi:DtxR family Mn-dependent transcriptional regulator